MRLTQLALALTFICMPSGVAVWGQTREASPSVGRSFASPASHLHAGTVVHSGPGGSCCTSSCVDCCPRPLMALMDKMGSALDCLLGCAPSCAPACPPPLPKPKAIRCPIQRCPPSTCGCLPAPPPRCHGMPLHNGVPTMRPDLVPPPLEDPFLDEPQVPPPPRDARSSRLWQMPYSSGYHSSVSSGQRSRSVLSTPSRPASAGGSVVPQSRTSEVRPTPAPARATTTTSRRATTTRKLAPPAELPVTPASRLHSPSDQDREQPVGTGIRRTSAQLPVSSQGDIPVNPLRG